jgi:hypothetical protein
MSNEAQEKYNDRLYQELLTALTVMKKNIGIYPPGHTTITLTTDRLLKILKTALESETRITFAATKKVLILNGHVIESKSSHVHDFALFLNQRGIGSLTIESEISPDELQRFYRLALSMPPSTQLYQNSEIEQQINALEHVRVTQLDFSGVQISADGISSSDLPPEKITTLWQEFMLNMLPPEMQHERDSALMDTTQSYDPESFKKFCQKYKVTAARVLQSYEATLKENFSDVEEEVRGLSAKQAFLKSMQGAMSDFSKDLKDQLLGMTVSHMNSIEDAATLEEILFSMPGEMIVEALEGFSAKKQQISPALTKLLGSMSRAQEQGPADMTPQMHALAREKIQTLFNKERYEKYVPEDYSDILQSISAGLLSTDPDRPHSFDTDKYLPSIEETSINRDVTIALVSLIDDDRNEQVYAELSMKLSRMVPGLLESADYALLVSMFKILAKHAANKNDSHLRNAATKALDEFSKERFVELLAQSFVAQPDQQDSNLEELVMLTGARNLGWLSRQYLQQCAAARGQHLFLLLCRFGVRAAEEAVKLLPECDNLQVMALLRLVRACGDNSCIVPVRKLLSNSSPELRLEALRTLLKVKDSSVMPILKKMLYARNLRSVETSLKLIQENDVQELAPDLAAMIKTLFIAGNRQARNKACLSVLSALGNTKVIPALQRVASAVFSFTPLALRQTQLFLYKTLSGYPREAVQTLLMRGVSSGNPNIRRVCQEIINTQENAAKP